MFLGGILINGSRILSRFPIIGMENGRPSTRGVGFGDKEE